MARPKKTIVHRRTARLEIRLTPEEFASLMVLAKEAGLTVSDFLRKVALDIKPRISMAKPERAALIIGLGELGKIGSNINQIARAINRQQVAGNRICFPMDAISAALFGVQTLSDNLIKELTNGN